jgi:hypothetical protein
MDLRAEQISSLRAELEFTRKQIGEMLRAGDQVLAVVASLAVAVFVVSDVADPTLVAATIPFALLVPGAYALRLNALIQHLGGYRRALEEALNRELERDVHVWEIAVAPIIKTSISGSMLRVVLGALWIGAVGYALIRLRWDGASLIAWTGLVAGYVAAGSMLALGWVKGLNMFEAAYTSGIERLGRPRTSEPSPSPTIDDPGYVVSDGIHNPPADGVGLRESGPSEAPDVDL